MTPSSGSVSIPRRRPRRASWVRRASTGLLALALAVTGVGIISAPAAQAAGPTVVSLTFDDGTADQLTAAQTLDRYGLKGTFYVNSGVIDTAGYLSLSDLRTLAAAGHEIGGHTVTHPDLVTLPVDEATRQVCNDRANLTAWGFRTTSFAYPFASSSPAVETIARDCGYNSARGLGDIQTRFSCPDCPLAEQVPPANPWNTAAPDQVENTWTLADLQNAVTRAESVGGWVQLTFHRFADPATNPLAVTPALFDEFAAWLQTRPSTTSVRTVDQVIGGTVKPVAGVPAPPPPAAGTNLVKNPSLETDGSGGFPQCWQAAGFGTNTPVFSTVAAARTGTRAETVTITGYASGDAKLLPLLDTGTCAPEAVAGRTYSVRAWYTSTAVTQLALYYRNSAGGWVYWTSGPWLAATGTYTQASFTTPALPAGATAISFGMSLFSNGTVTTDDYAMYDTVGAPPL